ncbi:hypothetical protein BDN72DRAFT_190731, partial [Pluteus cervinus]
MSLRTPASPSKTRHPPSTRARSGTLSQTLWDWAKNNHSAIFDLLSKDLDLLDRLSLAVGPLARSWAGSLATAIQAQHKVYFKGEDDKRKWRENIIEAIGTWVGTDGETVPENVVKAFASRQEARKTYHAFKKQLSHKLGFRGKSPKKVIPEVFVHHLGNPDNFYPPAGWVVAECPEARDRWNNRIRYYHWHDLRDHKRHAWLLNPDLLQTTIQADESVLIYDAATGELVGVVIRDFCAVAEIIQWIDTILRENLRVRRNIRKGDPGKIVIVGYSAGPRNAVIMEFANNIDLAMGEDEEANLTTKMCYAMALFWNLCKAHLPAEVIDDVVDFLTKNQLPRMDFAGTQTDETGLGTYL